MLNRMRGTGTRTERDTAARLLCGLALLVISTGASAASDQDGGGAQSSPRADSFVYAPIQPSGEQSALCLEINKTVSMRHYARAEREVESLAQKLLDSYLDNLDYRRLVLLAPEVDAFKAQYLARMADTIRDCDLKPAYTIFNTYRKSALDRYDSLLAGIEKKVTAFDYSIDETWQPERNKLNLDYPKNADSADSLWRKYIKNQTLALRLSDKAPGELVETIKDRLVEERRALRKIYSSDIFSLYINSYLRLFDTHTSYFPPAKSEDFNISMRLSLEGIGAMLRQKGEYTEVSEVLVGGPAAKQSDLRSGDRIIGVAQGENEYENVIGWRLDKVIEKIRGPRNSTVRLKILSAQDSTSGAYEDAKEIAIVRDKIKLDQQAARKKVMELEYSGAVRRIGVITLPSFYLDFNAQRQREADYRSSTRDVSRLLSALEKEKPPIDGLVIDLRNNAGGSLSEANTLTGMFIEMGPVVQVKHSNGHVRRHGKLRRSPYYDKPLAVLINRASASASEIFSAAIQDYGRGIVVGTRSYGKGTVQSLHNVSQGQVKITDAKFYRISGVSTQRQGVVPDVSFPPLYDGERVGEDNSEFALNWDQIGVVRHRHVYGIQSIVKQLRQLHSERTRDHPEFNYLRARAEWRTERNTLNNALPLMETKRRLRHDEDKQRRDALELLRDGRVNLASTATVTTGDDDPVAAGTTTGTGTTVHTTTQTALAAADAVNEDQAATTAPAERDTNREDPMLIETGLILLDSMRLLKLGGLAAATPALHKLDSQRVATTPAGPK